MRHKRWVATAWYRTEAGLVDVEHQIDELEELQALIERGPDWHTLYRIEVRLGHRRLDVLRFRFGDPARLDRGQDDALA
jgi:hypothetical protein